jgi:putative transposase
VARTPRLALAGELHYLLQRGHNRQGVFADDHDREAYLNMLRDAAGHYAVSIHGYVLLAAEVHLLVTPAEADSLSRLMQSLGRRYVARFNRRHGRIGTLWAGRFQAGLIDGATFGAQALVHIESLPVRKGLAVSEAEWHWSSAAHHLGRRRDSLITEHPAYWSLGNTPFERELAHAQLLNEGLQRALVEAFDATVVRGRALGASQFLTRVAAESGLDLRPKRRGRPPSGGSKASRNKTVPI